ncbi:MAG: precorrin-2 C(20)-methyltransferase, partial [Nitrospirae bacterium]|nr:precorrin-2 C(20)-methyltransferase [Nitrospirota bacterium]
EETVEVILSHVLKGKDIAFPTLGDPLLYSTFFYIHDKLLNLLPSLQVVIVPGVSSMSASSASAGMPLCLGSERIALLPATYEEDKLKETLLNFDTIILMKVNKIFDKILGILEELRLVDSAVVVEMASTDKERIIKNLRSIKGENLHYFTTMIIKK